MARYGAIGSRAFHVHVVEPRRSRRRSSTPLDTASSPDGAVISIVNEALSIGWSLAGNHVAATSG